MLSPDGTLEFPDASAFLRMCEQLRARGQFDVQLHGEVPGPAVKLRIHVPNQRAIATCTASLRQTDAARATLSVGRSTAHVLEHLEAAAQSIRGLGPASMVASPMRPATPDPSTVARITPVPAAAPRPTPQAVQPGPPLAREPDAAPISAGPLSGRIVRSPDLEELRVLFSGRPSSAALDATHIAAVVGHLSATRATGQLRVVGPRAKGFWVVDGRFGLSQARPPRPDELLGHLVMRMGRLASWQPVEQAVARARQSGRRLGELLLEMGVVQPWQLDAALRRQCETRLLEASEWQQASYDFVPTPRPADGAMVFCGRMNLAVALARHRVARAAPIEIQSRFDTLQMQYARPRQLADLEEMDLFGDGKTGTVLRRAFPGTHRLRDAVSTCPLGKVPTMRLLLLLEVYGGLHLSTEPLVLVTGSDAAGQLRRRALKAREEDHFHRLGAHHAMHADQIREAYARTIGDYSPGGRWERLAPDAAAEMLQLLEESYQVLSDPHARRRYRRELLGEDRARYVAELYCARAHVLAAHGQVQSVRPLAEVALELADLPEAQAFL